MGLVGDLRSLVLDVGTSAAYADSELTAVCEASIREICLYTDGEYYTLASLDSAMLSASPSFMARAIYSLSLSLAQIKLLMAAAGKSEDHLKFTTQDTTIDPGNSGDRLTRTIKLQQDEFRRGLNKWIGLDGAGWVFQATYDDSNTLNTTF